MLRHQELERGIEESTRATGRVADCDAQQPFTVLGELRKKSFFGCRLTVLVREIFRFVDAHFGFLLSTKPPNCILHNIFCDILRCIKNAIALSFANSRCFSCVDLRRHFFYLVERVLKDMPQYIDIDFRIIIVVRQLLCKPSQNVIADFDTVQYLVWFEQATVVGKYLVFLALPARVHVTEILFDAVVQGYIRIHFFKLLPLSEYLHH